MFSQFPQMFTVIWGAHKIISVIIQTRLLEWSPRIGSWTLSLQQREYSPANTLREHLSLLSWCTLMSKQRSFFPTYWVFSITIKITLFCKKKKNNIQNLLGIHNMFLSSFLYVMLPDHHKWFYSSF